MAERWVKLDSLREYPTADVNETMAFDAEKLALGAYRPLEGFMTAGELASSLERMRLPDGRPWPIPILLAPLKLPPVKPGDRLLLRYRGRPVAVVDVEEVYRLDRAAVAEKAFGTRDPRHPNVEELMAEFGEVAVAGRPALVARPEHPLSAHEPTPAQVREEIARRGLRTVACFQCRNPPHRGHEYMQRVALELAEGLLIHPVLGRLKRGDYRPEVIYRAYRYFVEAYYPADRVMLAPLLITMRYAGPRAAVFLAAVRRNYGCTHMAVGRDIAGVGGYYDPYAAHRLLSEFAEELGMEFIFFTEAFYCRKCGQMATEKTCPHRDSRVSISQTAIRELLARGKEVPPEMMRPDVVAHLLKAGEEVGGLFVEENSS